MLKKIVYSTLVLVVLSGCATHQQSNQALGAVVGGVVGNRALGGPAGAVIGAVVGTAISSNQPRQSNQSEYYSPTHRLHPNYSICAEYWHWQEREACYRGVENRLRQEQNQRNSEAYRQGYGR